MQRARQGQGRYAGGTRGDDFRLVELLPGAIDALGFGWAHAAFFAGMAGIFVIDMLVPHDYIGQHDHTEEQGKLMRTGVLVALGMAIHNFPEGLATFAGSMMDDKLGLSIAAAIAVHNIPEGLAVSAPGLSRQPAVGIGHRRGPPPR